MKPGLTLRARGVASAKILTRIICSNIQPPTKHIFVWAGVLSLSTN